MAPVRTNNLPMKAQLNIFCVFNKSYSKRFSNSLRIEYVKNKTVNVKIQKMENTVHGDGEPLYRMTLEFMQKTMTIGKVFGCNHEKTDTQTKC